MRSLRPTATDRYSPPNVFFHRAYDPTVIGDLQNLIESLE